VNITTHTNDCVRQRAKFGARSVAGDVCSCASGIVCPYCSRAACLVDGVMIYPHRSDLHDKKFYLCPPCDAYVGCHPGTTRPLGRLANTELRAAKIEAHAAFDPLWREVDSRKRSEAHRWLADRLGIPWKECHVGEFDVETCKRVVKICNEAKEQR